MEPWDERMLADALAAQKFTRKYFVIELDFTMKSVEDLEVQFDAIRYALRGGATPENLAQLRKLWGAYLGEMLKRHGHGEWIPPANRHGIDEGNADAGTDANPSGNEPGVKLAHGCFFPHESITVRMELGPARSIVAWLNQALQC